MSPARIRTSFGIELVARLAQSVSAFGRFDRGLRLVTGGMAEAREEALRLSPAFQALSDVQMAGGHTEQIIEQFKKIEQARLNAYKAAGEDPDIDRNPVIEKQIALQKQLARRTIYLSKANDQYLTSEQKLLLLQLRSTEAIRLRTTAQGVLITQMAALAAIMVKVSAEFVKQGSELESSQLIVDGLAHSYGLLTEEIETVINANRKFGVSTAASQKITSRLVNENISLADATRLIEASARLAQQSFKSEEESIKSLTDSVINLSRAGLKSAGIATDFERLYEKEAAARGLIVAALGETVKHMAVLNHVDEKSLKLGVKLVDITELHAVSVNRLNDSWANFGSTMSTATLPMLTKLATSAANLLDSLNEMPKDVKYGASALFGFATAAVSAAVTIKSLGFVLSFLSKLFVPLIALLLSSTAGVVGLLAGLTALGVGLVNLVLDMDKLALEEHNYQLALAKTERQLEKNRALNAAYRDRLLEDNTLLLQQALAARKTLEAQLDSAKGISDLFAASLREVNDELYAISQRNLYLDKELLPLKDALFLLSAATTLLTIPLERPLRAQRRAYADLEESVEETLEAEEKRLDILKEQLELIKEALKGEKDKLEAITHDIFMEELRNRILKKTSSGRLLELRGAQAIQRDVIANKEKELKSQQDTYKLQRETNALLKEAATAQVDAARKQIEAAERQLDLIREKETYQREELELAEARQASDRLAITQEERIAKARQEFLTREQTLIQRIIETRTKLIAELTEDVDRYADIVSRLSDIIITADADQAFEIFDALDERAKELSEKPIALTVVPTLDRKDFDLTQEEFNNENFGEGNTWWGRSFWEDIIQKLNAIPISTLGYQPPGRSDISAPTGSSTVINNTTKTYEAPTVTVQANYSQPQSPVSIRDDVIAAVGLV